MFSRLTRTTYLAVAVSGLLSTSALASGKQEPLNCAALAESALPVPQGYAEQCLGGAAPAAEAENGASFVPGDTVFYCSLFSPNPALNRRLLTAPLPTATYTNVGPCSTAPLTINALDFDNTAAILYAIDSACAATCTGNALGTINQTTGVFTPTVTITGTPAGVNYSGLKFDPTTGTAYIITVTSGVSQLRTLNIATGATTLIGGDIPGLIVDLAISNTGVIYAHDVSFDRIITINKTTGATAVVGPTGINANFAQGMDFDASDNTLYAFTIDVNQVGRVGTINLTTGAFTPTATHTEELEGAIKRAAVGPCTTPVFGGLTSATSAGTSSCAVNLAWSAATACPGTTVKYNVYRSTTPGTAPSAATLLQSCVTGLTYTDTTANNGTRYYYIVRAEDNTSGGTGACNSGLQDANVVERSAVPSGPNTNITDDVESGGANWSTAGGTGTNVWAIVTTQAHSPTHSWFVADPDVVTDQRLTAVTATAFPASGGQLSWWQSFTTEDTFDGHVLEYSLDGGTTWSDILAAQGTVPANPNRFTLNGYNATISTAWQSPIGGRRAWSGTQAAFQEVRVDMGDFASRSVKIRFRFASDSSVSATGVFIDDITFGLASACTTVPQQAVAPEALTVDAGGNGVYQPNETVTVAPTWRNVGATAIALTGTLSNHTGPAGATYTIPDASAAYASIAVGGTGSCGSNCYSVANTATTRPITHWDSTALETVTPTGATKTWTLHIGDSFTDVPPSSGFYRFIETILHKNVTGGCAPGQYCPSSSTTRAQMAVFVLVAREPAGFNPPNCVAGAEAFSDMPASSPFCKWVEELFRRGVVSGCGNGQFCTNTPAARDAMAVFVLRTLLSTLNPPNCVAGAEMFADVPASSPFCKWIEELVRRGVVSGCGNGNYCPTANVTREQMAVFLTVTFGLTLYGL